MPQVLVSLSSGAGVVRDDDGVVVVTADIRERSGVRLRTHDPFHPVSSAVDEDRRLVGGLLPPGAVSAEVVDDRGARTPAAVGGGVYLALLEQPDDLHEPVVCCRDAAHNPVRRPWAADYPSVPVTDAVHPCPACGATDFEEYRPFEEWRGGEVRPDGTTVPTPVVSCRVCGQEECEGLFVTAPPRPADSQERLTRAELVARAREMRRERMWLAVAPGLQAQNFPVYVADGWPAQLGGCASEDDGRLTRVTLHHYETEDANAAAGDKPRLRITTMLDDPQDAGPLAEARQALRAWVRTGVEARPKPGGSHAATTLWLRATDRARNAAALDAIRSEHTLVIDGTSTTALMLTASGNRWAAVAVRGALTLVVAGHDVAPGSLRLDPVAHPVQVFGPRPAGEGRAAH